MIYFKLYILKQTTNTMRTTALIALLALINGGSTLKLQQEDALEVVEPDTTAGEPEVVETDNGETAETDAGAAETDDTTTDDTTTDETTTGETGDATGDETTEGDGSDTTPADDTTTDGDETPSGAMKMVYSSAIAFSAIAAALY